MDVAVIGFRAGSQSVRFALKRLGYRVFGMADCIQRYSCLNAWWRHATGRRQIDFKQALQGYGATIGVPCTDFPEDLVKAYPDIKIILLKREYASWFRSVGVLDNTLKTLRRVLWFMPRMRAIYRSAESFELEGFFRGPMDDFDNFKAKFEELDTRVRRVVPDDRILVYQMGDGWEPMCAFLGKPVPTGDFPWVNKGDSYVKKRVAEALSRDILLLVVVGSLIAWFGATLTTALILASLAAVLGILYYLRKV